MSSRHTTRRPNRRQIDKTTRYIAPLALNWTPPGIVGPFTIFEGGVNQTSARITTTTGGPEVARFKLTGIIDGGFQTVSAVEIANEGEGPEGTKLEITFPGVLTLDAPWELAIPADTQLIQSHHGGRLTGTFIDGQTAADGPGGFVRLTNLADTGSLPPLMYVDVIDYTDPDLTATVHIFGSPDPITIDGLPPFFSSNVGPVISVADAGGGTLLLTWGSAPGTTGTLAFPAWDPSIKGPGGQWLAPFQSIMD